MRIALKRVIKCAMFATDLTVILQQRNDSSTDKDLLQLIATLSKQIPTSIKSPDELINAAMTRVVVAVGRDLLNGGVMLLPDVHNLFNLYASELSSHLREEIDTSKLVTSANILSNLKVNLQHHIAYSCKTRKHGTLIYRPNADIRPALLKHCGDYGAKTLPRNAVVKQTLQSQMIHNNT